MDVLQNVRSSGPAIISTIVAGALFVRLREREREHRSTILDLAEARRRFFADHPDPLLIASHTPDRVGQIVQSSESANAELGVDLAGHLLEEFVDRELLDILAVEMGDTTRSTSVTRAAEGIPVTRSDGSQLLIDASIQPIEDEGAPYLVISFRDASERVAALGAGMARAERDQAQHILTATHHQLSREIVLVGMEIDDLRDSGVDTAPLESAYDRLTSARDGVVALAELGVSDQAGPLVPASADEVSPSLAGTTIGTHTLEPLVAVNPRVLRLALREIILRVGPEGARNFQIETERQRLQMTWTDGPRLELVWTASENPNLMDHDPLPITRRVLAVHKAGAKLVSDGQNGTVIIDFPTDDDNNAAGLTW